MANITLHKNQSGGRLALGVNEALLLGSCVLGVSLSEPHTSETTLRSCVAILVCLWPMHDYCQSAALATRSKSLLKSKQLLVCASLDHQRQVAHRQY